MSRGYPSAPRRRAMHLVVAADPNNLQSRVERAFAVRSSDRSNAIRQPPGEQPAWDLLVCSNRPATSRSSGVSACMIPGEEQVGDVCCAGGPFGLCSCTGRKADFVALPG